MHAIPEHLRGVFMTKHYTNTPLPLTLPYKIKAKFYIKMLSPWQKRTPPIIITAVTQRNNGTYCLEQHTKLWQISVQDSSTFMT